MSIERITVVGAGQMGAGIAQVAAQAGLKVTLTDLTMELAQKGRQGIEKFLRRSVEKGRLSQEDLTGTLQRIEVNDDLRAASDSELIIEAVIERTQVKCDLFSELDSICPPQTIFASNTSSISITELGAVTQRPERVIGMHFMNPVPLMKLVEVIRGQQTADEVHDEVANLSRSMGKTPVTVDDYPGFIANRLLMPMINEAVYCLMENVATKEDIDTVMKLGMNHPMGPLALADLIGLDTCLAIMDVLYEGFGDPKYRPCPLLRRMVRAGLLGMKTKQGFYQY